MSFLKIKLINSTFYKILNFIKIKKCKMKLISLFFERLIDISNIYHKSKSSAKIDQLVNNLLVNNLLLEFLAPTVLDILYPTLYLSLSI